MFQCRAPDGCISTVRFPNVVVDALWEFRYIPLSDQRIVLVGCPVPYKKYSWS
ncbi:MAG: hypothetical protein IPG71_04735 [bacterium]|nr:hypothetical protein [bacterium]